MALTVADLIAKFKIDNSDVNKGLDDAKTKMDATAASGSLSFGNMANYISGQAKSSGQGILSLTKYLAMFGVTAGVASAAVGLVIGGLPIAFAAAGGLLLKNNAQLQQSFTQLGQHIKNDLTQAAQPLVPVFKDVAHQIGDTFNQLRPLISTIFSNIGPQIHDTVEGVLGMVSGMMPGITSAVARSGTVVAALDNGLSNLGIGLGLFFQNLMGGANGAASGLNALLSGLEPILATLGSVLGALAQAGGPIMNSLMPILVMLINGLAGALIPLIKQLGPVFGDVLTAIQPVVAALGQLFAAAGPVIASLGQQLGEVLAGLAPVFTQIVQAAMPLLPLLANVLGPFTALVPVFTQIIGQLAGFIGPLLAKLGPTLYSVMSAVQQLAADGLQKLFQAIVPLLPQIAAIATKIGGALLQAMQIIAPAIEQVISALLPLLPPILQLISALLPPLLLLLKDLEPLFPLAAKAIATIVPVLLPLIQLISETLIPLINSLMPIVQTVFAVVARVINDNLRIIQGVIEIFGGLVSGNWSKVWQGIKDVVGGAVTVIRDTLTGLGAIGAHLWDWLGAGVKDAANVAIHGLNWLIDRINSMTSGLSEAWSWAGIPGIPAVPHIPALAKGGTIDVGGLAVVGDAGPEIVSMPAGAKVSSASDTESFLRRFGPGSGGNRAAVHIDHFHATPAQSPQQIARELDWLSRAGG